MTRELSDDFKLSVRGIAETSEALGTLVARVSADRSIRYRNDEPKRPTKAAVVLAMILYLDQLPHPEQKRVIGEGMRRLNDLLEREEPGSSPSEFTSNHAGCHARKKKG